MEEPQRRDHTLRTERHIIVVACVTVYNTIISDKTVRYRRNSVDG